MPVNSVKKKAVPDLIIIRRARESQELKIKIKKMEGTHCQNRGS